MLAVVCSLFVICSVVGLVVYRLSERLSLLQWRVEMLEGNLEQLAVSRRSSIPEATEDLDRARLEAFDAELLGLGFTASEASEGPSAGAQRQNDTDER